MQQVPTLTEALDNVSGLRSQPLLNRNLDPLNERRIRGFNAEVYRGGFPLYYNAGDRESLANVERIEVLKGPTALLYANSVGAPTGGLINLVQKRPEDQAFAAGAISGGSFGRLSGQVDLNVPLATGPGGAVLSRLTADVGRNESPIDVIEGERASVDPTVTFRTAGGTALTVHARWSQVLQHDYTGLPIMGTIVGAPYTIDRTLYPGSPSIERSRSQVASIDATLEHDFDGGLKLSIPVQYARSSFDQYGQYLATSSSGFAPSYFMDSAYLGQEVRELSAAPILTWRRDSDELHTTLAVGGDYDYTTERGTLIGGTAFPTYDVTAPVPPPYLLDPANATYNDADNVYQTMGGFVQMQATYAERVTVVAGLRYAYAQIRDRDRVSGSKTYDERELLPRLGAIVGITRTLSAFAGYGEGFRAFPYSQYVTDPKPEASDQVEAGLKLQQADLISATASVYRLTRTNVTTDDPDAGGFTRIQTGEQRSDGLELDVVLTPGGGWTLAGNYAYTDAWVARDTDFQGKELAATPRHAGRFWLGYAASGALEGFSLGGGVTAVGKQQVNLGNAAMTPGYAVVDAQAAYTWRNCTLALSGRNLLDRDYWEPYSYIGGPRVSPGEPRSVAARLETRF
jgi:iron complex outermembrane receptor protein